MREGARAMGSIQDSQSTPQLSENLSVDWKEALYLATRGGALALGLHEGAGTFVAGAPFDAQHSQYSLLVDCGR